MKSSAASEKTGLPPFFTSAGTSTRFERVVRVGVRDAEDDGSPLCAWTASNENEKTSATAKANLNRFMKLRPPGIPGYKGFALGLRNGLKAYRDSKMTALIDHTI